MWKDISIVLFVAVSFISYSRANLQANQTTSDASLDLLPLESSNNDATVRYGAKLGNPVVEESKDTFVFRKDKRLEKNSPGYKIKMQNITDAEYNLVQWYSTPEGSVRHHAEGEEAKDLNAQSSSYVEGYSHEHDHDHHTHYSGDDQPPEEGPRDSSYFHLGTSDNSQHPESTNYEKVKRKKPKKSCNRSKNKKSGKWPERADTIVHGMSEKGPEITVRHYSTDNQAISESSMEDNSYHSGDGLHSPQPTDGFRDSSFHPSHPTIGLSDNSFHSPKPTGGFIPLLPPTGFSAEHLHGIPKTFFSSQRLKGEENHFHLHNHHHYKPDEKKVSSRDPMESYDKIFKSLGKLKNMLPTMLSGFAGALPNLRQNPQTPSDHKAPTVLNPDVKFAEPGEKKGYHYTGPHKSYGKKTYIRMTNTESDGNYPSSYNDNQKLEGDGYRYESHGPESGFSRPEMDDHSIGGDILKYGVGQFGTDEYQDGKSRFPNEVNLEVDKTHPGIGFDDHSHQGYGHESTGPYELYPDYPSEFDSGRNKNSGEEKFSLDYNEKAPYVPYDQIKSNKDHSYESGYEFKQSSPQSSENPLPYDYSGPPLTYNGPDSPHSYDAPENSHHYGNPPEHQSHDGPEKPYVHEGPNHSHGYSNAPRDSSIESNEPGNPHQVTSYTVSYSHGGGSDKESSNLGSGEDILKNLRTDPDPLSIPKNAQIIEHFIHLDPVHYMAPRVPLEYSPTAGFQPQPAPNGGFPSHVAPNSGFPSHAAPNGDFPSHAAPNSGFPSHAAPNSGFSPDPAPNGAFPPRSSPNSGFASHQVPNVAVPTQHFVRHIPLHKLIPNPLKMPYPVVPRAVMHPNPHINQMLQAYQSRTFYHRWW